MKPILVSVIIPTYNRSAAISSTIESVLSQTLPREQFEIIIVDDGSTDDTLRFLQIEYSQCVQVRLISQGNAGVAHARNRGLQEAKGEFIAFLDHDDIWLPNKLEHQVAAFRNRPEIGVVTCLWQDANTQGEIVESVGAHWLRENPQDGAVRALLLRRNFIVSMSIPLIRREALQEIGGFDAQTVPCDDWDLWLRLSKNWKFGYIPKVLMRYIRHNSQQSRQGAKMARAAQRTLFKQWRSTPLQLRLFWQAVSYSAFVRTLELHGQARYSLFKGDFQGVAKLLRRVALRHPLALFTPHWLYLTLRFLKHDSRPY